jgi:formylglycine-generating enzyme required for sulfatase activity
MKHNHLAFLSLSIIILFVFGSGCKKDSVTEPPKDTEKPTVSILYPASGSDVKADTTYTVIADANDNTKVVKVEFYINGQNSGSDSLAPFEYRWSTWGLTTTQTIMAKAFDEAENIGTSAVISVSIKGVANHAPAAPTNPAPADSSAGQLINPTLRWSCSDPDGDVLRYDVYFDTNNPPIAQVATEQSAASLSRTGLSSSTKYFWKVVAKDNRGGTTTGVTWSFTTTNPPAVPSNPYPTDAATGVPASSTLSWSCSDPEGDALTYDVYFGISNPPTTQVATGQIATTLSRTGLSNSAKYYWKVNAKDSKGATTSGIIWSFTTGANNPPTVPSNPSPVNAATGISTIPTLSWSCSDPDGDALAYDVFLGTSNNPTITISTNQSATSINPTQLAMSTTYYWKITAKDDKGVIASGPVWSFTTSSVSVPSGMVAVIGGTFQMGSSNTIDNGASPPHSVTLSSFYLDKYEITYEKWTDVRNWGLTHGYTDLGAGTNGSGATGSNYPVTNVNWYDVVKWCNARTEMDGLTPVYYTSNTLTTVYRNGFLDLATDAVSWTANGYRLPTEAEWEYAARGGNQTHGYVYSGSNTIGDVAWYATNSGSPHQVGLKQPNELDIYDMSGNDLEWCWDWYGAYWSGAQIDPKGSTSGTGRVCRGGNCFNDEVNSRIAYRGGTSPGFQFGLFSGFRCVQD